jgi:hypothetical protein
LADQFTKPRKVARALQKGFQSAVRDSERMTIAQQFMLGLARTEVEVRETDG